MLKKLTKMHWYDYNYTVLLLNIAKKSNISSGTYIILKISKFSTILPASQPTVRPGSTRATYVWFQIFHTTKLIASSL